MNCDDLEGSAVVCDDLTRIAMAPEGIEMAVCSGDPDCGRYRMGNSGTPRLFLLSPASGRAMQRLASDCATRERMAFAERHPDAQLRARVASAVSAART